MSSNSETPSESGMSLDSEWRMRVRQVGKRNFENEEMLRLGFIGEDALKRLEARGIGMAAYREAVAELRKANSALRVTDDRVAELEDVEFLVSKIRARRIERVKADREIKKAEKQEAVARRHEETARRRREEPTFLGRRVSRNLRFSGGDRERLTSRSLPVAETFVDLAGALSLTPERLQWLVYERAADATDHYTRFEIPKRSGGTRLISSPKPALRTAQEWVRSRILHGLPVSGAATAFRPGASIVDNATRHVGAGTVVRIDLKDFFPSIGFDRVLAFFRDLGYNPGIASIFALICTDAPRVGLTIDGEVRWVVVGERGLPQGACTSPDLANLITRRLDSRLTGLALHGAWTYTRYADDLVFSHADTNANVVALTRAVSRIAGDEGFTVNDRKTRIMRSPNRQMVTGLLVNDGVRLSRRTRRQIRAFLHRCSTRGLDEVSAEIGRDARAVAKGYLAFAHMVDPVEAQRLRAQAPGL